MYLKNIYSVVFAVLVALLLVGCRQDWPSIIEDSEIAAGDAVMFATYVPDAAEPTRSAKTDWEQEINSYKPVQLPYDFTIRMYQDGQPEALAQAVYRPAQYTTVGSDVIDGYDGTLVMKDLSATPLMWQDNVNRWGFRVEANNNPLEADQSSEAKWLAMDYLTGQSHTPTWTGEAESGTGSNPDHIQYKSSKEWYAANKLWWEERGLMPTSADDYKKIPLYLRHERAWITVILRAGEGMEREALAFNHAATNISATFNSFSIGSSVAFPITQPWAREALIDYDADRTGPKADNVSTTRYDAIVMPHNYATRKDEEVIARINVSSQNFSFYASNDNRFLAGATAEERREAEQAYDLEAGKHLTIEATLSRESRKILITAWIEDWAETATATICDDYGQNGDPIVIKNRAELIAFLSNDKVNKQGSVGIIQPASLPLDSADQKWSTQSWPLNATLNLAGCELSTSARLFTEIGTSGNLVNGSVLVTDDAEVPYAIAPKNKGTIERVNVTTSSELSTAHATIAGMVGINEGTIYQCTSSLPVLGTTGFSGDQPYIGGIAAVSHNPDQSSMAVIDGCMVNAAVKQANESATTIRGGGIAGYATGRISNCTYEYGISIRQSADRFFNIFATAGSKELRAYNNGWPTIATNPISTTGNDNIYPGSKVDAVLDCQEELDYIMTNSPLNATGKVYRVSRSFSMVSTNDPSTDWVHGEGQPNDYAPGPSNVSFILDGNNKTITLTGTKTVQTTDGIGPNVGAVTSYTTSSMLFHYVLGEIRNLTVYLDIPLVASPTFNNQSEQYTAEDAVAPLAYALYGENARLTNVKVKADDAAYVQASTPAGLVVWALGGATISGCSVKVPVRMWLPTNMGTDSKHYAGGLVACAGTAAISECNYYVNSEDAVTGSEFSTSALQSPNYYYGGIVGGTSIKTGITDKPSLQIVDCTSWFQTPPLPQGSANRSSRASIIANSTYADSDASSKITNGMSSTDLSEGNWWALSSTGCKVWVEGLNEEMVIGKRNAAEILYPSDF